MTDFNHVSPFVYGRPVRPDEFLGRERELGTVLRRLQMRESTAIVGAPHIGKSSLLVQIADEPTRRRYLGEDADELIVSLIDLHPIDSDCTVQSFWEECLEPLEEGYGKTSTATRLEHASNSGYDRRSLIRLFNDLYASRRCLVLLLDEFESLLGHSNFSNSFFTLLRSLSTHTSGLALVIASRLSVAEMNVRGRSMQGPEREKQGSPILNHLIELRLRPFTDTEAEELLNRAGDDLSSEDQEFAKSVAGYHPFLLQAIAAEIMEARNPDRHAKAGERFYSAIAYHFDDLWHCLSNRARTAAVILALAQLHGHALREIYSFREINKHDAFGPELRELQEHGLSRCLKERSVTFDWRHIFICRDERWTIGAEAFVWWVIDVVVSETREIPTYSEWLSNSRYLIFLTQGQWDNLTDVIRRTPNWVTRSIGQQARAIFEELIGKNHGD